MTEMIEGRNAVLEAFRSGKCVDKLFILDGCQDGPVRTIAREARKHDTIVKFVPKERLDSMSETGAHQGVIAQVAAYDYSTVEDILKKAEEKGEPPFIILLDNIEEIHGLYSPIALGIAAALACGGFTFLLGGGPIEMFCAFVGAGLGNFLRCKLTKHHYTLFLGIVLSVSLACLSYAGLLKLGEIFLGLSVKHEAGYICAMLFIIPGFPFITSGIDLAKLDMRSGIERLGYALIIILVATMSAWIMALILHLQPVDFIKISLPLAGWIIFRFLASFCGVFGFSIMFNSPIPLAVAAASIGAIANTLRLELVDLVNAPPAAAAFIGALTAGILASLMKDRVGYPRISVTVPSIVIMVPGLYLYRGFYNLGIMSLATSATWFASALLIILALPLGLIFARILTDKTFRYCT